MKAFIALFSILAVTPSFAGTLVLNRASEPDTKKETIIGAQVFNFPTGPVLFIVTKKGEAVKGTITKADANAIDMTLGQILSVIQEGGNVSINESSGEKTVIVSVTPNDYQPRLLVKSTSGK